MQIFRAEGGEGKISEKVPKKKRKHDAFPFSFHDKMCISTDFF